MIDGIKIGLALGSGGARGFCHVGVLRVLEREGIIPDVVAGCSMGAIAGSMYCAGVSVDDMEKYALEAKRSIIADYGGIIFSMGVAKGDRSAAQLRKMIGDKQFEELNIPLAVTACNLVDGKLVTFTSGSVTQAVRASYSIPVCFKPVKLDDMVLVDGGVLERIPVNAARDLGADIVIAVDAIGEVKDYTLKNSIFSVAERTYLLFDEGCFRHRCNESDCLIVPDIDKSIFDFTNNHEQILAGELAAELALPKIWELIESRRNNQEDAAQLSNKNDFEKGYNLEYGLEEED